MICSNLKNSPEHIGKKWKNRNNYRESDINRLKSQTQK